VAFGAADIEASLVEVFGHDFMWNPALSISEIYPKESYFTHYGWDFTPRRIRQPPISSSMRHIPFQKKSHRLHSITAFLSENGWLGIDGFECIFQQDDDPENRFIFRTGKQTNCPVYLELWTDEVISHVWIVRETMDWALMQEQVYPEPIGVLVSPASSSYPHSSIQSYSTQDTVSDIHLVRNELWQSEVSLCSQIPGCCMSQRSKIRGYYRHLLRQ
jgi:hypothetical protein